MAQSPLLVWLLGSQREETNKLWHECRRAVDPSLEPHMVGGYLNLMGVMGGQKLYAFMGQGARRGDVDVLIEDGEVPDFLHHLCKRVAVERGLHGRDVVLIYGNLMLAKLNRLQAYFTVRLLSVDSPDATTVLRLTEKLKAPVEVLADPSGPSLLKWVEAAAAAHVRSEVVTDDLVNDPYLNPGDAPVRTCKIRALHFRDDKAILESCRCFIPELRGTKRPQAEESEDGSVDEDGTYMGPGVTRKRKTASASSVAPVLTTAVLKGWVAGNLKLEAKSILEFRTLKERMCKALRVDKISDLQMNSAGLYRAPSSAKTYVKDCNNNRLGLK